MLRLALPTAAWGAVCCHSWGCCLAILLAVQASSQCWISMLLHIQPNKSFRGILTTAATQTASTELLTMACTSHQRVVAQSCLLKNPQYLTPQYSIIQHACITPYLHAQSLINTITHAWPTKSSIQLLDTKAAACSSLLALRCTLNGCNSAAAVVCKSHRNWKTGLLLSSLVADTKRGRSHTSTAASRTVGGCLGCSCIRGVTTRLLCGLETLPIEGSCPRCRSMSQLPSNLCQRCAW